MRIIGKTIIYTVFLATGIVMGLITIGAFIENKTTLNGIAIETLSKEQISEIITINPVALKNYDSIIISGEKILTVEGIWLPWFVFLIVALFFVLLGHTIIIWKNKNNSSVADKS